MELEPGAKYKVSIGISADVTIGVYHALCLSSPKRVQKPGMHLPVHNAACRACGLVDLRGDAGHDRDARLPVTSLAAGTVVRLRHDADEPTTLLGGLSAYSQSC
jgi:hypothetical protein